MKQTAVEWFNEEFKKEVGIEHTPVRSWLTIPLDVYMQLIAKAEQMEAEQTISKMETIRKNGIPELSDEEIEKAASSYSAVNSINELQLKDKYNDFIYAAKWYREQLK